MFNYFPVLLLLSFILTNLGCFKKDKEFVISSISQGDISFQNCQKDNKKDNKKCLENFPNVLEPFLVKEKSKTALIIGKYLCLSKNKKSKNIKFLVKKELMKENIDVGILNSYEVLLAAKKISNLLDKKCKLPLMNRKNIEEIFKNQFKYN